MIIYVFFKMWSAIIPFPLPRIPPPVPPTFRRVDYRTTILHHKHVKSSTLNCLFNKMSTQQNVCVTKCSFLKHIFSSNVCSIQMSSFSMKCLFYHLWDVFLQMLLYKKSVLQNIWSTKYLIYKMFVLLNVCSTKCLLSKMLVLQNVCSIVCYT